MDKEYYVEGMHCSACVQSIEELILQHSEVINVQVNLIEKKLFLKTKKEIPLHELNQFAQKGGYYLTEISEIKANSSNNIYVILFMALVIMILGMFFMEKLWAEWLMALFSSYLVLAGKKFYINAYQQAKIKKTSMDTLVALSTGIAYSYSLIVLILKTFWNHHLHHHTHFEAAGMIIAFVLLGKFLEEKAQKSTQNSLKSILHFKKKQVSKRLNDGSIVEIPVNEIQINDIILVKAGEQIPIDGKILEGETFIDESMITGESIPTEKKLNDKVYAGSINQFQNILVLAEKTGEKTFLEQIIKAVEKAQSSKPKIQKLTDKIAGQFALLMIMISLITFFTWLIFGTFEQSLISMVSVLVVACPCALGLATPMAVIVGIGKAAKNGILIRDANVFQILNNIQIIAFDKTGTLTEGKPSVEKILWNDGYEKPHLKTLWSKLAQQSNHPLAMTIHRFLEVSLLNTPQWFLSFQEIQTFSGKGIQAKLEESTYFMGNEKFLEENQIFIPENLKNSLQNKLFKGKSFVFFARNQECIAVAILSDQLRKDTPETISLLQKKGLELWILSGDKKETVSFFADQLKIKNFEGDLLPMQKAKKIAKLKLNEKKVAMVGDGINDSIALSKADVSIAMASGSELSSNVANIVLIKNNLKNILQVFDLSKQTQKLIYQNLFWAFIYNLLMIPLAAGVFYPILGWQFHPMWASAAMSLSSISVVLNSLRLQSKKRKGTP